MRNSLIVRHRDPDLTSRAHDPFATLDSLFEGMLRPTQNFLSRATRYATRETENSYQVALVVPGRSVDTIDVSVDAGMLSISAPALEDAEFPELTSEVSLRLSMPENVDVENISAQVHEGLLVVNIPFSQRTTHKVKVLQRKA